MPNMNNLKDTTVVGDITVQNIQYDDSGWIFIGLRNSWLPYTSGIGGYGQPRFRKLNGIVYINCMIKSGTLGTEAFILPVGFRPSRIILGRACAGDDVVRCDILDDGRVIPRGTYNGWFSIQLNFVAEGTS